MSRPRVFITRRIPQVGLDLIGAVCDVDLWDEPLPPGRDELLKRIAGCDGVLTMLSEKVDDEFFDAAGEQLKVVSQYAVGFNNIDVDAAKSRNIAVGNTPGALTAATADLGFALLIAAARRLVEAHEYIHADKWKTWEPLGHIGWDLEGKTVGIVGMGRIGQAFAQRCYGGWGMNVIYTSRSPKPDAETQLRAKRVSFDELLEQSDFISVHTDLNEETAGMFNKSAFEKMKSNAIFINTARGGIHNQSDLVEALKNNVIGAAGLDVTDPEPPALDDPILHLPNCVVAPHIGSATISTRNAMAEIASDNLLNGIKGEPLRCSVT
ncbi:MAG: 2-hydroxyacid dehydrogenase [Rubinisphaera brasiliensis]|uniref:Glyoxylate/hydroxypyruvate reductase B n=1 Tax=Rubinisphaera brasiliensis (strain ATCC 49424 / DSM 5305 / JCM 21570 / IAM 15109 / NBRC 103401 / IFAM 1448) TaxID=756272 RepID=F0SPF0_RUBBR|nr:D-glycerate dehydrogenase [Rubinisphaera brasiliensis]ADY62258.1 Glyoxylate reductase [Rubinisphaera brasiliensis DSM 5305]MBR9801789.1 D-glycerate dehydrogenase [bacterium]